MKAVFERRAVKAVFVADELAPDVVSRRFEDRTVFTSKAEGPELPLREILPLGGRGTRYSHFQRGTRSLHPGEDLEVDRAMTSGPWCCRSREQF